MSHEPSMSNDLTCAGHSRPVYRVERRLPTHNYSVLALVWDGPFSILGEPPYWEVCAYIKNADDGPGWYTWSDEKQGDVRIKVSHWCDLPWIPEDHQATKYIDERAVLGGTHRTNDRKAEPVSDDTCAGHIWIANSGQGGGPEFRLNRMMSAKPLMHVRCDVCGCRTWFTEEQWEALAEVVTTARSGSDA